MITKSLLLTIAALALLPTVAIASDISGDYGHATVGADNNDDAGDVQDTNHNGENDGAERPDTAQSRTAEDGRRPVNSGTENQGDFGND